MFDVILIDCPPGLSVLTESWLREADYHISPTKADYVSVCGLEVFRRFKALNPEMGFAENLGVLVNMKDMSSPTEEDYHAWLLSNRRQPLLQPGDPARGGDCRNQPASMPRTARISRSIRARPAKALRQLSEEVLARLEPAPAATAEPVAHPGR